MKIIKVDVERLGQVHLGMYVSKFSHASKPEPLLLGEPELIAGEEINSKHLSQTDVLE